MTGLRARTLGARGAELPGVPQLTKISNNHHYRLSRLVVFEVLKEIGVLYGYDEGRIAQIQALTGVDQLREPAGHQLRPLAPPQRRITR
jgi:hypothetical protein